MSETSLNGSSEEHQLTVNGQLGEDLDFRVLAETIPHFVWSAKADGITDYYNARFLEYLGRSLEEMHGWTWVETLHPDDRQRCTDSWTEAFTKGAEFQTDYRIRRGADGSYLWHEGRATPLRDSKGSIIRWFGTCTNIEERKQMENQLRESENKFRLLHESMRDAFVCVNMNGQILEFNSAFKDLLGYTDKELCSKTYVELTPAKWHDLEARILAEQIIAQGYSAVYEKEYRRKDGTIVPIELRTVLAYSATGEPDFMWAIIRDITERKQSEEKINKLNIDLMARAAELERANQELETFNYSVSHDLRKPLTLINGYCQVMQESCSHDIDTQFRAYLKEIHNGAQRMDQLIDALLNFSRVTRSEVRSEPVDLSEIANVIASELSLAEPGRSVKFRIADGITARGDTSLLRVVLENLITNAWKYTSRQEVAVIEFGMTEVDGMQTCFIRDNGIGFDMADVEKLFIPFQRLPGTDKFRGHGIGLATVERIIRRHGGRIWADGEAGKGATFYFTL